MSGKDVAGNDLSGTTSWTFTTPTNKETISGVVRDSDGYLIASATVLLSNGEIATTDADGDFELKEVPSGTYALTVSRDGCEIRRRTSR